MDPDMPCAVNSTFDVAFWFVDVAQNESEFLQPQKLHRLLFLAQAYYGVAHQGAKLMPAVFVAEEMGPIEPTIYTAFSKGRPKIDVDMFLPAEVEAFLESIWQRFGQLSSDRLGKMAKGSVAYRQAMKRGRRAEITLEAMVNAFKKTKAKASPLQGASAKVMRSQTGDPVKVTAWTPKSKSQIKTNGNNE
tara:strand:+ start:66 stop:635 length:570 start_codon:yes stop_codon:yes gene_type:complete